MKVVIVDYGMGNIFSLAGALNYLGITSIISHKADDIHQADKLFLPGVGAFHQAMQNIKKLNLDKILHTAIIDNKKPVLGICLGMQLMAKSSTENQFCNGLGFIDGAVKPLSNNHVKIPHVGFNQIRFSDESILYRQLHNLSDFYFTHSFKLESDKKINAAYCHYGEEFIVSYEKENIAGVQFHPELSQTNGLQLLKNFIENF